MSNRIIKESICSSEKISSLTDFEFRLWVGLITQADDLGRGDARPAIIKGRVFPLRDRVTAKDIDAAVHGLAAKGCVSLYTVGGKPYFWFPTWSEHQRIRDVKPKYPGPEDADDISLQSAADCSELRPESNPNPNTNPNPNPDARAGRANTRQEEIFADFPGELGKAVGDWLAYKTEKRQGYKPTGLQSLLTQIRNAAKEHGDAAVVKVIRDSMAANYQGIVFDRLSRHEKPGKKPAAPESKFDAQPSKAEQERLKQLLEGMGG